MSLKSILLVFATVLLGLSSCTEETAIEPYFNKEGSTNKLSFVLSTSPTITKADGAAQIATAEELNINNCVLAVFEKKNEGEAMVFIKHYDSTSGLSEVEQSANPGTYSLAMPTDVFLEFSKSYRIVIIANPNTRNITQYTSSTSYKGLQSIVEGSDEYAFVAANLMKFGEKDITGTELKALNGSPITVPLTQLAARIDLKIQVDLGKTLISETYTEGGAPLLQEGNIKGDLGFSSGFPNTYKVDKLYFKNRHITLNEPTSGSTKYVLLNGRTLTREHKYASWTIKDLKVTVKNVRGKVIAMIPTRDYEADNSLSLFDYGFTNDMLTNVLLKYVTFYTYQRDEVINSNNRFAVELSGNIHNAEIIEQTTVTGDFIMLNLKKEENLDEFLKKINNPTIDDKELTVSSNGAGKGYGIIVENRNTPITEVPGTDVVVGGSESKDPIGKYSGSFPIKPKVGSSIAYGNRYRVTATIKNLSMPVTLNWEVDSWSNVPIDIPEFN